MGLVHFFGEAELLKQRRFLGVELHALDHRRLEAVEEAQHALVFGFGVDPDHAEIRSDLIAQHALDDVQIVVDERRWLRAFGAILDVLPQALQEADVGAELFFAGALRGRADNEAAVAVFALAQNDPLQALALFVRGDLARDTGMVHGRHVDQEPALQRDVTGDARAFLADGLLGDLDQNFLAFFQQIADEGDRGILAATETASASTSSAALPVARATVAVRARTRALRALRVSCGCRRSTNFHAGVNGTVAASLRVQQGFRFSLGLFEFQFLSIFFPFGRNRLRGMSDSFGERRVMNFSDGLAGVAIQMSGAGLRFLFEFVVAFVGRSFVMDGTGLFIVDGLFFHGAGSGEDRRFILAARTHGCVGLLAYGCGLWLMDFFFHFALLNRVLCHRKGRLSGPSK